MTIKIQLVPVWLLENQYKAGVSLLMDDQNKAGTSLIMEKIKSMLMPLMQVCATSLNIALPENDSFYDKL